MKFSHILYPLAIGSSFYSVNALATTEVSLLHTYDLPTGTLLDNHTVKGTSEADIKTKEIGGVSDIVMTSPTDFIALTDSRSRPDEGLSRFYKGSFSKDYSSIRINETVILKNDKNTPYGANEKDPESIVLLPNGSLVWGSEGSHTLINTDTNGKFIKDFSSLLPSYFLGDGKTSGLRKNQSFEGMSLSPDGSTLFVATESALAQDGSVSTTEIPSAARILKFAVDKNSNLKLVSEYTYIVDRINVQSDFGIHDNGISEILAINNNKLLVVERNGYAVKEGFCCFNFDVNVFKADLSKATNILGTQNISAKDAPNPITPASKELVFNFGDFVESQQNYEGLAFGPKVNGKDTLLFAADNNFQPHQKTQLVLMSVTGLED
ncbi:MULTISPECIES: esterase-like activity of phytase family protein [Vibrio harveyi group]|uniref:esterase-like activity of phytase family protein n=1 Tax=Vibrio harveyi group TaxID=717610 RepID=UPI00111E9147|nr:MULTISPECIES: esterase-like activity of phytase family protein [Vibrio harveyi group]ELB2787889.1 esterase-like activity of phytase family protein [Vibrio alginolyticus]EGQ7819152.1 esterase-like activity of phytase family protein [Vibrio parahaemolyticus]EGQ8705445.1 hypothetical protein [Vibrio parahaemolyticus]EGR3460891.1 esterase-like activity of phytase family protein [Vibrio parahaemolyticus]EJC6796807.1 esterase-like activity of phytase family protein [Vibrio parahaemolyticus]